MTEQDCRDYRSLGEILTDAREARGWSVEEVAERTKISPRQIHALEGDDLASLNGPVYARGFLRNLCTLYDLDRQWLTSKLDASLESVGESVPEPILVNESVSPKSGVRSLPEQADEKESATEATWTIETVDNSRVRRIRVPKSSAGPKWIWVVVGLIFVSAVAVWAMMALRSREATDREDGIERSEVLIPSWSDPEKENRAEAEVIEGENKRPLVADRAVADATSTEDESETVDHPTIVASSGTRVGDEERVPYDDASADGISSVLRMDDVDREEMTLRLRAVGLVTVRAGFDGGKKETRQMRSGQSWTLRAFDHFAIEFSDVSAIVVEVDGVRREAPRGLRNEWIIYPLSKQSTPD